MIVLRVSTSLQGLLSLAVPDFNMEIIRNIMVTETLRSFKMNASTV